MNISLLYHGTIDIYAADIICNGVCLSKSNKYLDFGPGFYTTNNVYFAMETANNRTKSYNLFHKGANVKPRVVVFECDDKKMASMSNKKFLQADSTWATFILANRCTDIKISNRYDNNLFEQYDIVTGPTADGKGTLTPIIAAVSSGELAIEDANYHEFAPAQHIRWGEQISFHTDKALSCIKITDVLY